MNGLIYKEEIERIFSEARSKRPDITNDMLDTDGAIHYMNGNDGTVFDWNVNDSLCEFFIFYESESKLGFIKVCVGSDNVVNVYMYEDGARKPMEQYKTELTVGNANDFANLMHRIADTQLIWDSPIDELDWDIDTDVCTNISRN